MGVVLTFSPLYAYFPLFRPQVSMYSAKQMIATSNFSPLHGYLSQFDMVGLHTTQKNGTSTPTLLTGSMSASTFYKPWENQINTIFYCGIHLTVLVYNVLHWLLSGLKKIPFFILGSTALSTISYQILMSMQAAGSSCHLKICCPCRQAFSSSRVLSDYRFSITMVFSVFSYPGPFSVTLASALTCHDSIK